eukprot:scaffold221626_cov19-Tisochrysis_lutea.AAC.1
MELGSESHWDHLCDTTAASLHGSIHLIVAANKISCVPMRCVCASEHLKPLLHGSIHLSAAANKISCVPMRCQQTGSTPKLNSCTSRFTFNPACNRALTRALHPAGG